MPNHPTTIHLGLPKTATTCLQRHLFAKHSQVHYFGKFQGGKVLAALRPAVLAHPNKFKEPEAEGIYSTNLPNQLRHCAENNLFPVLSREGMAGGSLGRKRLQARLFKHSFGACKIILFIREPVSFFTSYYAEMLKSLQTRRDDSRTGWMKKIPAAPHYFDINEWMSFCWNARRSPKQYISYADTAQIYAKVFGEENIKLFLFEEFIQNPKLITTELCQFIGIDPEEGIQLVCEKRENERITTDYICRLKQIESTPELKTSFQAVRSKKRKQMLNPADFSGEKFQPELSEYWLKKINGVGDRQNQRLMKQRGLPLSEYGYRT